MTLQQKQSIFAANVAKLINYIFSKGYSCSLGEAYRTSEQAAIYAKEGKGIIDSLHCKRLAIDINLFDSSGNFLSEASYYSDIAKYWESLHSDNRAGINFKRIDADHFEMKE